MNSLLRRRQVRRMASLWVCGLVVACGGGGSNDGGQGSTVSVSGVFVRPTAPAAASREVLARAGNMRATPASAACPDVPDGYQPLASVKVDFLDADGDVLASLTTDACGAFSGTVPEAAASVSAAPAGLTPITQPVSGFTGAEPGVASSMPASADVVISVLQDLGAAKVALTITDSETGKAVLGLDKSNFAFGVGSAATGLAPTALTYGASSAESASLAIVLDASSSMDAVVGTTGKQAIQIASAATHELLDGLSSGSDQAGVVIFSSGVYPMKDATLAALPWVDAGGSAAAPYSFSASGLTQDTSRLRPVADLYNRNSMMYPSGADPVHADTGDLHLASYVLSGNTSFFDGVSGGLTMLNGAKHARRIVVAMTDGQDNDSVKSAADVIAEAKSAGVPLYLVGFNDEGSVDEAAMFDMADETGGEYKRVEGDDLTGLFQSIQTGIRFQYVGTFGAPFAAGSKLNVTVKAGGKTARRALTIR